MKFFRIIAAAAAVLSLMSFCPRAKDYGYVVKKGKVEFKIPERPADQQSMLGFACAPIDTVRVGFVGVGSRGTGAVKRWTHLDGVKIVAICDKYEEQVRKNQGIVVSAGLPEPAGYWGDEGYKQLCERDDIDIVYIATSWQMHVPVALYAMEHGKHAAIEVPAATSIEDSWKLINTAERKRLHCMMLENCCYDFFELTTLNMAQQGLLGEIVHGEGAYIHNLDPYWDAYRDDWRMQFNKDHKGDVYPTHGLGPVCQVMNIHRGDRFETLVAMETAAFRGQSIADKRYGKGTVKYMNGDNTCTMIRTAKGRTILVEHEVTIERPYDRMYQITGTKGYASKYPVEGFAINMNGHDAEHFASAEELASLKEEYRHPIIDDDDFVAQAKKVGGHGGMDFIMDYRLVYCLRHGLPLDMDVYDLAEWCCLGELGRISIENGNIPVSVPDFTRGGWNTVDGFRHAL